MHSKSMKDEPDLPIIRTEPKISFYLLYYRAAEDSGDNGGPSAHLNCPLRTRSSPMLLPHSHP
jgi:hypothetical protein